MGRATRHSHYHGITTSETSVLDGAIRIIIQLNWVEQFERWKQMVFGITKDDSIIHKEIGQGYISINDVLDGYESPWVILP